MEINLVKHYSKDYWKLVRLRDKILREPLNLMFSEEELFLEHDQIHIGCFEEENAQGALSLIILTETDLKMRQVCVSDEVRQQGIGKKLVQFSENWAKEKGYTALECNARESAVPFYLNQGYEKIGDLFHEVGIPHYKMKKSL